MTYNQTLQQEKQKIIKRFFVYDMDSPEAQKHVGAESKLAESLDSFAAKIRAQTLEEAISVMPGMDVSETYDSYDRAQQGSWNQCRQEAIKALSTLSKGE